MPQTAAKPKGAATRPPDWRQRRRIRRQLDTTMLVEAAAGTGKTTMMVERMIALLAAGKCRVERLAAVTFTRKAAAELRARFQAQLQIRARQARGQQQQRLLEALARIDHATIGTIHSFCARLLRERPVEAGVQLDFREIDEEADARIRRNAWDQYVARLYSDHDPVLDRLQRLGLHVGQLLDAFLAYANYPDVDQWPTPTVQPPEMAEAWRPIKEFAERVGQLPQQLLDNAGSDRLLRALRLLPGLVAAADANDPADLIDVLQQCHFTLSKPTQVTKWRQCGRDAREEMERWNQFVTSHVQPCLRAWRSLRYQVVMDVLAGARREYDRLRSESGVLNFQDLLLKAAELLRDKPHIRRYFRRRFSHLLVDEFQDTDPIQAEVMLLLTAEDPHQQRWERCRPVPGSLFVVGDPKQSIYRFRRADIVTYQKVHQIIQRHGEVVRLSANFRSLPPVRDWVNQCFQSGQTAFPGQTTDYQAAYVPLQAGRTGPADWPQAGVWRIDVPKQHPNSHSAAANYDSQLIARAIRQAIDSRQPVPPGQSETAPGLPPHVTPGDFMIITYQKERLSQYARQLEQLGIPHEVTGGSELNDLPELQLLHLCLWAATQPDNPVALVAALRSELFGITDQTLYAYKRAGGSFSFHSPLPTSLSERDRAVLADAFDRLRRYARWLATLPPVAAVERVADDLGLWARAAAGSTFGHSAGSLAKAVELLRQAQSQGWSPAELVEYVGQLAQRLELHDGLPVRPPDGSAVRIMNLHKAKGLEAPFVFLADPSGYADHDPILCIDRSGDQVLGFMQVIERRRFQRHTLALPADWEQRAEQERRFQQAEQLRLLYVAATRAGTQLVVSQRSSRQKANPWSRFAASLAKCAELPEPGEQAAPARRQVAVSADQVRQAAEGIGRGWQQAAQPTYQKAAAKAISVAGGFTATTEHGTEWGSVIHALLEAHMLNRDADLRALAAAALEEQGLEPSLRDQAVQTVQAVARSEFWQRALASSQRLVEVPFQMLEPDQEPPTLLRGVIDLVFREADGWTIVDYKTDDPRRRPLNELVDHYAGQLRTYARAWEQATGQPVRELGLYFTTTNQYVSVPRGTAAR